MSIFSLREDILDDVIDLNHESNDLYSINSDELKLFHRELVTPAPSVYNGEDDMIHRNMFRKRYPALPKSQRPISRGGESVMLFKKINNGDDDVSIDLVSSELRDFMDTDFMMYEMLPCPVSTTIDPPTQQHSQKLPQKKKLTPVVLNYQQRKKSLLIKQDEKVNKVSQWREGDGLKSRRIPESPKPIIQRLGQKSCLQNNSKIPTIKDDHTHTPVTKRTNSAATTLNNPRFQNKKKEQPDAYPLFFKKSEDSFRHYGKKLTDVSQYQLTPRNTKKPEFSIPTIGATNNKKNSPSFQYKSDPISFSSSSSSDSSEEEYENKPAHSKTSSYTLLESKYHEPSLLKRYSIPSQRKTVNRQKEVVEKTPVSSSYSRIKTMNYKSTLAHHSTATMRPITTTNATLSTDDLSVTNSAKRLLASIRERRKSSMLLLDNKVEHRRNNTNNHYEALVSDFQSRLSLRDPSKRQIQNKVSHSSHLITTPRKLDLYPENKSRFNGVSTRLPQRTLYH